MASLLLTELERLALAAASALTGTVWTLDFRTLQLERHGLTKRPQCPVCGNGWRPYVLQERLPAEPLRLSSRRKADYRDGGERICSAVETLESYAHLISPLTGIVSGFTLLPDVPACFGAVVNSDWIVRAERGQFRSETVPDAAQARASAMGRSTGKGRTLLQSRASALGESIERYCSQFEGYEPRTRASYAELGEVAIPPQAVLGFSPRQYAERERLRALGSTSFVPDPYEDTRSIDWTPVWSLTQQRWRLVPSAFAYYAVPPEAGGDICRGDSNGVAAGNCLEEALLQGLFELVERDAVAMWWYHRLRRPAVDWRSFHSPFAEQVGATLQTLDMRLEILDLTHDLGLPVFSANAFHRDGGERFKCNGYGCHRDPRIALERAVSELGQSWYLPDMDEFSLKFQSTPLSEAEFLWADPHVRPRVLADFDGTRHDDFLTDIEDLVARLRGHGLELLVLDLTRPDVGFSVARAIVPGLVHFWPRLGCRRLYEVPQAQGWVSQPVGEDDLNPIPFFW